MTYASMLGFVVVLALLDAVNLYWEWESSRIYESSRKEMPSIGRSFRNFVGVLRDAYIESLIFLQLTSFGGMNRSMISRNKYLSSS
ncbi:hypothetical protein EV426DRAFT_607700 [Tirmania nivea]|nr:hypothetical protein EV426DRAFT_607700 [Tirmania nivea]